MEEGRHTRIRAYVAIAGPDRVPDLTAHPAELLSIIHRVDFIFVALLLYWLLGQAEIWQTNNGCYCGC